MAFWVMPSCCTRKAGASAAQGARVDAMLQAGKHPLDVITCVLDLSEIEADHVVLRPVELDLRKLDRAVWT